MASHALRAGLALAILLLSAAPAAAVPGLFLTWDDCGVEGAGVSVKGFGCDVDTGSEALYCALVMPQAIDSVLSMEIVIDVQVVGAGLPDWWRYDFGGCHEAAFGADVDFAALNTCSRVWPAPAQVSGTLLTYTVGMPRGAPNQARIHFGFAVPSNQPLTMNGTDMYYAARIQLDHAGATAGCEGCDRTACLVLNSIRVGRPPRPVGVPSTDVLVVTPGLGNKNWASWQASSAGACQAVPVRNMTWGQLKTMYR